MKFLPYLVAPIVVSGTTEEEIILQSVTFKLAHANKLKI